MRLRALIADDEPLARRKIKTLLERESDAEVAGECGSGPEAARLIRELEPKLVFLDIEMPELDGLSVLKGLKGLKGLEGLARERRRRSSSSPPTINTRSAPST